MYLHFFMSMLQGDRIHAVVSRDSPIMHELVEGLVYKFSKFGVLPNEFETRVTNHKFVLQFDNCSIIEQSDHDHFRHIGLQFHDSEQVLALGDEPLHLIGMNWCYPGIFIVGCNYKLLDLFMCILKYAS